VDKQLESITILFHPSEFDWRILEDKKLLRFYKKTNFFSLNNAHY